MLLGIWRNIADLEECLSLPELNAVLEAGREKEHRHNTFVAALKGIDLNEGRDSAKERFEQVQMRAQSKLSGVSTDEIAIQEFGIEFETED